MAKYVDYGPIVTAEAPIICTGADLLVFALEARMDRLESLCRKVFEEPTEGAVRCKPLGPFVVAIFSWIRNVQGGVGGPGVREKNVLLHVPVLVTLDDELPFAVLFSPFVWVDNPNSLTGGREVFGYAKTWGSMRFDAPPEPELMALDTFGGQWSDDHWKLHRNLIQARRKSRIAQELRSIIDLFSGISEIEDLVDRWADRGVTEILFKQFRAITDRREGRPPQAALRQVATVEYVVFDAEPAKPLSHSYEILISDLDSHPVRRELGLSPRTISPGYRLRTNFRLEHGRVLWDG